MQQDVFQLTTDHPQMCISLHYYAIGLITLILDHDLDITNVSVY